MMLEALPEYFFFLSFSIFDIFQSLPLLISNCHILVLVAIWVGGVVGGQILIVIVPYLAVLV